jgi:26S proteasome regulatory subunit N2
MKTDDAAAAAPAKPKRKAEATTDRLSNLSRVTPAQLSYISFPSDARYVPVRPLFSSSSSSTPVSKGDVKQGTATPSIGAGGGILMMRDNEPTKEAEFLELEVMKVVDLTTPVVADDAVAAVPVVAGTDLTGPIADAPEPFEFEDWE